MPKPQQGGDQVEHAKGSEEGLPSSPSTSMLEATQGTEVRFRQRDGSTRPDSQKPAAETGFLGTQAVLKIPAYRARPRGRLRTRKRPFPPASQGLFEIRINQGLTLKQVEDASQKLAQAMQNDEYHISAARLSQIENGGTLPGIYKLDSLRRIYRVSYAHLLELFGIDVNDSCDWEPARTIDS